MTVKPVFRTLSEHKRHGGSSLFHQLRRWNILLVSPSLTRFCSEPQESSRDNQPRFNSLRILSRKGSAAETLLVSIFQDLSIKSFDFNTLRRLEANNFAEFPCFEDFAQIDEKISDRHLDLIGVK